MSYFEDVLIRLRREYSNDEYVSSLLKDISNKDIEIGKLTSFIHELESKSFEKKYRLSKNREKKLQEELKRLRLANTELLKRKP